MQEVKMDKKASGDLLEHISSRYLTRLLEQSDIQHIYELCSKNEQYYRFHPPFVTVESIAEDMEALPPGKDMNDKFFFGFFENNKLAAIMDLIIDYPQQGTAFIGLFMMDKSMQGNGTGSFIISECVKYFQNSGFEKIRLAVDKGNPQSKAFWLKNGFAFTGEECPNGELSYLPMERVL